MQYCVGGGTRSIPRTGINSFILMIMMIITFILREMRRDIDCQFLNTWLRGGGQDVIIIYHVSTN